MTELKPCPFCGGEGKMARDVTYGYYSYWVFCTKCHAQANYGYTEAEAAEAWNTRADEYTREDVEGAFVSGYSLGSIPVGSDPQWDENRQTVDEHMAELGWVRERTCRFIDDSDGEFPPKCSACDYEPSIYECSWLGDGGYEYEGNYCPSCGARVMELNE